MQISDDHKIKTYSRIKHDTILFKL